MATPAFCLLFLVSAAASAQSEELDSHISEIKEQFQKLDTSAEACLAAEAACQDFLTTLNSELPQYLQHCEALREWREQLVTSNSVDDSSGDAGLAQRLIDVEFTCGEDALIKRTDAVLAAYDKTQGSPLQALPALVADTNNREARQAFSQQQNATSQRVSQQQQRLRMEIQQQWQRIQLENVREQNRRPLDFGTFPN